MNGEQLRLVVSIHKIFFSISAYFLLLFYIYYFSLFLLEREDHPNFVNGEQLVVSIHKNLI